jgi:hypothetical protein
MAPTVTTISVTERAFAVVTARRALCGVSVRHGFWTFVGLPIQSLAYIVAEFPGGMFGADADDALIPSAPKDFRFHAVVLGHYFIL